MHRTPRGRETGTHHGGGPMKIHEYQAKEVLRKFGVPTPRGIPCFSVDELSLINI